MINYFDGIEYCKLAMSRGLVPQARRLIQNPPDYFIIPASVRLFDGVSSSNRKSVLFGVIDSL